MNSRYSWVDISKGIAIILVVVGHVIVGLRGAGIAVDEIWGSIHNVIYSFHMPLFFMMSGFFIVKSLESRTTIGFSLSKVDSIVYPYALWMLIQASALAAVAQYTNSNHDASWSGVIQLYPAKDQFWFLYHLMLMMLVTLLLFSVFRVSLLLATIASLVMYFTLSSMSGDLARFSAFYCYFLIGSLVGRDLNALQAFLNRRSVLAATLTGFIVLQYLMAMVLNVKHNEYGIFTLAVAFVSIMFILSLAVHVSKLNIACIRTIGQASMLIFLGHILSGSGVRIVMQKLFDISDVWIHFPVGVFMGVVPWLVIYQLSQRYRVLEYLYQISCFSRLGQSVKRKGAG